MSAPVVVSAAGRNGRGSAGVRPSSPSSPPKTRAASLRSYDVADFPPLSGREEQWRFTPVRRLGVLATADATTGDATKGDATKDAMAGGSPVHEHDALPPGVSVSRVPAGGSSAPDRRIGSLLTPFDRVSALAYGRAETALVLSVARAATPPPATLRVTGAGTGRTSFGHTYVEVGELSQSTLVFEHVGVATLADNVEVNVGDGAQLTLVTVANWAADAVHAQHVRFRIGRDARVVHVQVALGGSLVRQYTSVEFTGRGGDCEAYGLYFADTGQHLEHRLLVDHATPDCHSYVSYRGALQGAGAHTVWVGDVLIRAQATGTDTYEINRNLVLSDGARADSVPNLEIETGEVARAGHASTTGRFDDEQLFYLMSRGIPAEVARRLVVRGFFAELLGKIPLEELRERLAAAIDARLGETDQ